MFAVTRMCVSSRHIKKVCYTHTHAHTHTYTHTHTHTRVCMAGWRRRDRSYIDAMHDRMGIPERGRIQSCMHACMPACLPSCLHACLPACMPACLPAYACLHACLHAHLHACMRFPLRDEHVVCVRCDRVYAHCMIECTKTRERYIVTQGIVQELCLVREKKNLPSNPLPR